MRARALVLILLVLSLAAFPATAFGAVSSGAAPSAATPHQSALAVTARLGISAGNRLQTVDRGTDRRALERMLPELFETATMLGVRVETVSVGRGFWSEDGEVESENDLDLVVSGVSENVLALGATLGQRWNQSTVLVWESAPAADMLTATLPLPGGTAQLNEPVFEQLAKVLSDGGHIRYAGADSLVFVAHTGDDSQEQFRARMASAQSVLTAAGVRTGALAFGKATMVALTRAEYQQYIDGAIRGKAA
jgi:hypothetical protein